VLLAAFGDLISMYCNESISHPNLKNALQCILQVWMGDGFVAIHGDPTKLFTSCIFSNIFADQSADMYRTQQKYSSLDHTAGLQQMEHIREMKFRAERNFYLCVFTLVILMYVLVTFGCIFTTVIGL
jgi:hypothetical protein